MVALLGFGVWMGRSSSEPAKIVVQERVVENEVRVVKVQEVERTGPPGHRKGKKKGWQKHN